MAEVKKKRSSNFSERDCIVLAQTMNEPASINKSLSRYRLLRHKLTPSITSFTKKALWPEVAAAFNVAADVPRQPEDLSKKWDNLVQSSKAKYGDFIRLRNQTGNGTRPAPLSPVTEAVMDVIGRGSIGVAGLGEEMDTTLLQIQSTSKSNSSHEIVVDASPSMTATIEMPEDSASMLTDILAEFQQNASSTSTKRPCSKCQCSDCVNFRHLKLKKIKLEIKQLENRQNES